jgi:hypothetical protein
VSWKSRFALSLCAPLSVGALLYATFAWGQDGKQADLSNPACQCQSACCGAARATSKPPARRTIQPSGAKAPPSMNVNVLVGPASITATGVTSIPKCNVVEERAKLDAAQYARNDGYREQAANQYLALLKSCDPRTRVAASDQFHVTHEQMSSWWWQMGRYFPPFRWYNVHFPRFWIALAIAGALVFAIVYVPKLRVVHGIAHWFAKPRPGLTERIFATQFPRASIMTPSKLTPDTQADLFAAMLQSSADDARRVLERAGGGLQVRSTALLSLPSEMTARLTDSLPTIKGVDLTGFARFFLYVKRYFGWRVESQVGFCPPTRSTDGSPLTPGRLVASATLHSAWKLRGGPWPVARRVQDQYDIDAVAFAIAVRIMGMSRGR